MLDAMRRLYSQAKERDRWAAPGLTLIFELLIAAFAVIWNLLGH